MTWSEFGWLASATAVGVLAAGLVAQVAGLLARSLFARLEAWLRQHWKRTLAYLAIAALESVGISFAGGTAAGIAALIDEYSTADVPLWAVITAGVFGGVVYVIQRAGLPQQLIGWATTIEGRGATPRHASGGTSSARPDAGARKRQARGDASIYSYRGDPLAFGPPPWISVDVRHMGMGEALHLIERHLDAACRAGVPWVRVVHGKGTGTRPRAIRGALGIHPLVRSVWTPPPNDGGEGVTMVEVAG